MHYVNQLDASKRDTGGLGLEVEHGSDLPFDAAMILLDGIVHVFAGPFSAEVAGV